MCCTAAPLEGSEGLGGFCTIAFWEMSNAGCKTVAQTAGKESYFNTMFSQRYYNDLLAGFGPISKVSADR